MLSEDLAREQRCHLTTVGRRSKRRRTVELWFAVEAGRVYLLSGSGKAGWVLNLEAHPAVALRIGSFTAGARAMVVPSGAAESRRARELLDGKYMGWAPGRPLSGWAREGTPVVLEGLRGAEPEAE